MQFLLSVLCIQRLSMALSVEEVVVVAAGAAGGV